MARLVVRTVSEVCVTVGTLIVLFVVYVLFWTGVRADSAMDGEIGKLQDQWSTGPVAAGQPGGPGKQPPYENGKSFAVMYIPRFGADWSKPVLEGTAVDVLKKGLGHYERTARLGETGNFAVAGHRRTYGDPFKDFPRLRPGTRWSSRTARRGSPTGSTGARTGRCPPTSASSTPYRANRDTTARVAISR